MTILHRITSRAATQPDATALVQLARDGAEERSVSFGDLALRMVAVGQYLAAHFPAGSRIVVTDASNAGFVPVFLGVMAAGMSPVPWAMPEGCENASQLPAAFAGEPPKAFLTDSLPVAERLKRVFPGFAVICAATLENAGAWTPLLPAPDAWVYLPPAVNVTSSPQGGGFTHRQLLAEFARLERECDFRTPQIMVTWLPNWQRVGLLFGLLFPLWRGEKTISMAPAAFMDDPGLWLQAISRYRGTITAAPSAAYRLCIDKVSRAIRQRLDLGSLSHYLTTDANQLASQRDFAVAFAECGLRPEAAQAGDALGSLLDSELADDPMPGVKRDVPEGRESNSVLPRLEVLAARALQLQDAQRPDPHVPLVIQGMDSLRAVEFVQLLRSELGIGVALEALVAEGVTGGMNLIQLSELSASAASPEPVEPSPTSVEEPFPLTDLQKAYWVGRGEQLALGGVSCQAYLELECSALDVDRLQQAWEALVRRHEMLRAVILPDGMQRVLATVSGFQVDLVDASSFSIEVADSIATNRREALSHRVLPADKPPLLRVGVTLLPGGASIVHLNLDLLIADFGSLRILSDELQVLYRDPSTTLPPIRSSFREHALRVEAAKASSEYRRILEDWRVRNPSIPPAPELPLERRLEIGETPRFSRRQEVIPRELWERIEARARASGVSTSAVLLSTYCRVLTRWSSSADFHVTTTLFQRPPEASGVVGDFTTVAPVMPRRPSSASFLEYAWDIQRQILRGLDSRVVGGVRIQRELARHGSRSPSVVFSSFLGLGDARLFGWLGNTRYAVTQTPQVSLDHQVGECAEGVLLTWDAVEALFVPGMLDDLVACQVQALRALARDDWNSPLTIPLPEYQRDTRDRVNRTRRELPLCLLQVLFEGNVSERGSAPAIIAHDRTVGYAELDDLANRLGRWLRELGAKPGQLVAIALPRGWQQAVAVLGVLKSGAAYLPLDPDLPEQRRFTILQKAKAEIVISNHTLLTERNWPEGSKLVVAEGLAERQGGALDPVQELNDLAYVIFTSGSTGTPKGVMIDHRGACNTILDLNARHAMGATDRVLGLSALSFDLSVFDLFGVWAVGGAVVLPEPRRARDPSHWRELTEQHCVTLWNSVPALVEMLVEDVEGRKQRLAPSLRAIFMSGDWIPVSLPHRIRQISDGVELVSMGGATEASIWSIHYAIGTVPDTWKSIPYGFPMANQTFHVLDANLDPVPDWVAGRLYIGGDGVALGYWGDPVQTAERFIEHANLGRLYWTGDLGRYFPDGCIEFLGREDFQVKVQGYRIELEEIEAAMLGVDGIQSAVASVVDTPRGGKRLVGYFVQHPEREAIEIADIKNFLSSRLPEYMVPQWFLRLEQVPLSVNGKVDRKSLPEIRPGRASSTLPKASGARRYLSRLWKLLLRMDSEVTEGGFFELGGDSLAATKLVSIVRQDTGAEISLSEIFERPGLGDMAILIESRGSVPTESAQVPLQAGGRVVHRPEDRYQPFPMTEVQSAYWLGRTSAFELGNVACQGFFELEIDDLDVDRLEKAWNRLLERHDQLRVRVRRDGQQEVVPYDGSYRIERADCSGMAPAQREAYLAKVRAERSHMVVDPYQHHMFRLLVIHLGGDKYRLMNNLDLLVADYWSFKVLSEEWKTFYHDPDAELPELGLTFRDYLLSVREQEDSRGFEEDMNYWLARLARLPDAPRLPQKTPTQDIKHARFVRHQGRIAPEPWAALKRRAQAEGITPSVLILAAFSECLARHCDQPDFTLNLTLFNRRPIHPQVNHIMGDFTSVSLLEIHRDWRESFADWGRSIQKRLLEDLCHRRATGVHVLRELATRKKAGRRALMPVVFTSTLNQEVDSGGALMGWLGREVYAISQTPQVLLDHQVMEDQLGLFLLWDVIEEAYPEGLIAKLFHEYLAILEDLALAEHMPNLPNAPRVNASSAPVVVVGAHGCACLPWETGILHLPISAQGLPLPQSVQSWKDPVSGGEFVATGLYVRAMPDGSWNVLSGAHGSNGVSNSARPDPKSPPTGEIKDPQAKLRFKLDEKAVRTDLQGNATQLPVLASPAVDLMQRLSRRSYRRFLGTRVALAVLSEVLGTLSQAKLPNVPFPKMLYGSAGGLYPVQVYLFVKPDSVEDLDPGTYWYDPREHRLIQIRKGEVLPRTAHQGPNAAIFEQCGLQIFLVADRSAIEPVYGEWWRDFCLIEAGAMCQLLETRGPEWNVGLVQVGAFDLENFRDAFELGAQHVLLHTLLGGAIEAREKTQQALERDTAPIAPIAFAYLRESGKLVDAPVVAAAAKPQTTRAAAGEPRLEKGAAAAHSPTDDIQDEVCQLWQEVLGHADFSVSDNFFEAGGNSLLAVELANGFRSKWGLDLNVVSIFERPTIGAQAGLVAECMPAPTVVQVPDAEPKASDDMLRERMLAARQVSRYV